MDPLDLILPGGLPFIGGVASSIASSDEAKANRAFQERMSSTAHQREVKDLRKAGLNPLLSSTLGGESSPGGSSAVIGNPAESLGFSAIDLAGYNLQKGLNEKQKANLDAQTKKTLAEARSADAQADVDTTKKFLWGKVSDILDSLDKKYWPKVMQWFNDTVDPKAKKGWFE